MYLETLKVFCDLAETKSFSKAADANGITQSAVSQQIRALETAFHVTLVERHRKACALTPEGRLLLEASRKILEIYAALGDQLRQTRSVIEGKLRIGSIFSIGLHELPPRLQMFRALHPEVEVSVEYRRSPEIYDMVRDGEVDIGLVAYPQYRPGMKFEIFEEDELVVVCHPKHPLAARKTLVLSDLNGQRFIAFDPDIPTRKVIDRRLRRHRVELQYTVEFDNVEMVKRAVEINSGLSLVPRNTVQSEVEAGSLIAIPLAGERFARPLGAIFKPGRARSLVHKALLAALRNGELPSSQARAA
ncbi:MAG TPA: LysR family transcriptional regulator [Chthoniobacteraceae bacterium]|jgi:DNA-binding transcriptional LysR family regulator|nr:LysR family transcriptional regulator [Chthoniobacteraceae bacterium]